MLKKEFITNVDGIRSFLIVEGVLVDVGFGQYFEYHVSVFYESDYDYVNANVNEYYYVDAIQNDHLVMLRWLIDKLLLRLVRYIECSLKLMGNTLMCYL